MDDAKSYTQFMGRSQFGVAYKRMLDLDTHAPGSVDQVLTHRMVKLAHETVAYLYHEYSPVMASYVQGSRPELETVLDHVLQQPGQAERVVEDITLFTSQLAAGAADVPIDALRFGGTEEAIIKRGSDWCTDLARVACLLCQVAGVPARIVNLFNTAQAYSGHVIIEAYSHDRWGAVDPTQGLIYHDPSGNPASIWRIMSGANGVVAQRCGSPGVYVPIDTGQFRGAAIVNYFIGDCHQFDYSVSRVNPYVRSILALSEQGWPGGLRWLHGEDREQADDSVEKDAP